MQNPPKCTRIAIFGLKINLKLSLVSHLGMTFNAHLTFKYKSRLDVMIKVFLDFANFRRKNNVFLKIQRYDQNSAKTSSSLSKKRHFCEFKKS
jgi:hypothetical protein